MLVVYRIGAHIPTPGINGEALSEFLQKQGGALLGFLDIFSGGSLSRLTIFALGIMPYISASIILQLLTVVVPHLSKLAKEGERGRKKIIQYTRFGTIGIALIQGFGIAIGLEQMNGGAFVLDKGWAFRLMTVITLTAGTGFLMWLGEQITERGIGNGASLMIFFSILERIWPGILQAFQFVSTGALGAFTLLVVIAIMIGVVAGVVAITIAARRVAIQIPQRTMTRGRQREASRSFIPLRINAAGVMPIVFAQSVIVVPGAIATFFGNQQVKDFADNFNPGTTLYYVFMAVLILFFTYFYTSIIFNPVDLAENQKKQGGFIPGVKPGAKTAEYIDDVVSKITLPGSLFLTVIALLPIVINRMINTPFNFGGTSLLIVVGVALDTLTQMQQHLLLRKYDGFMKKGRVRFRGRQGSPGGF
jgi:preprotein translocase subunit SecY